MIDLLQLAYLADDAYKAKEITGPVVQWLRRIPDLDETEVQFLAGPFLISFIKV